MELWESLLSPLQSRKSFFSGVEVLLNRESDGFLRSALVSEKGLFIAVAEVESKESFLSFLVSMEGRFGGNGLVSVESFLSFFREGRI